MRLTQVLQAVASEPWAILPDKLASILAFLDVRRERHLTAEEIRAAIGEDPRPPLRATIARGVGILPLHGVLLSRTSDLAESSGVLSTPRLSMLFDQLMDDESVSAVVFDCDSPGGMVGGIPEFAAKIAARRGEKKLVAVVNGLCASAAYWLASQVDEVVIPPSGEAGAIGVITARISLTRQAEEEGIDARLVYAGQYKAEGHPLSPITEEEMAALQARVDAMYDQFVKAVAKGRGVTAATVRGGFGQGRVLGAAAAVAEGLADRVDTMENVLAKLGRSRAGGAVRSRTSAALADLPLTAGTGVGDRDGALRMLEAHQEVEATAGHLARLKARVTEPGNGDAAPQAAPVPASEPAPQAKEQTMPEPTGTAAPDHGAMTADLARMRAENERLTGLAQLGREYPDFSGKVSAWQAGTTTVDQAKSEIIGELRTKSAATPVVAVGAPNADKDPRRGFRDHKDFLLAAMDNAGARDRSQVGDERLRPLALAGDAGAPKNVGEGMTFVLPRAFTPRGLMAAAGSDEQGTYDLRYGGAGIMPSLLPQLLQLGFEGDPTAGRTQAVPMATPQVKMLARVDKDHSSSVSGGFTVTRRPETAAITASRASLEEIMLSASGLFGLAYATEELLTDSPISFVAVIDAGFRDQYMHHLLGEKLRGDGGAEFTGVINAPCTVSVAKESGQAADTIVADNVAKMRARCWGYGNAIWLANHDTYPQLYKLSVAVGVGGAPIYQPSLQEDRPDMLLGRPIFYTEYASTVGDVGDLILGNWSQFLEGTYQPLQSAESVHVRFVNHERTFKFWMRNAGAPWWRSALTPNKGANTLSPFVTLAARA